MNAARLPEQNRRGFTLVELMVSMAVLILLLLVTFSATDAVSTINRRTRARIDTFQEARAGFETVTRRLSQAMLNTYWDYDYPNNDRSKPPTFQAYVRQSELHFVSGPTKGGNTPLIDNSKLESITHGMFFQAPLGFSAPSGGSAPSGANLQSLLNVGGYFLEYTSDRLDRPKFLQADAAGPAERWRSRLMEFSQPSEKLSVYRATDAGSKLEPYYWFRDPLRNSVGPDGAGTAEVLRRPLAENIVALVLWPHRSPHEPAPSGAPRQLAPAYFYDSRLYDSRPGDALAELSRTQLPPLVQVTMVAIDETSASRLQDRLGDPETLPADELGLTGLFERPSTSANPTAKQEGDQYRLDLQTLEKHLIEQKLTYRVFSTDVSILQAKWSEN